MKRFILAFTALVGIGSAIAVADYTATQGAGTTFGSGVVSTIHYAKMMLCDLTAPATQCATVSATGQVSINNSQINGITPLMGNGVTGTGSQRVTIASDNTAFAVNATLSAETTKVIGTVRNIGNAGAAFDAATGAAVPANAIAVGMAQGGNLVAFTGTGGNLNTNIAQMNGVAVLMDNGATGTGAQRIVLANNNTLPTGWASSVAIASTTAGQTGPLAQCAVTTAAPTYVTAQTDPLSCDTAGSLRTTVVNANANGQTTKALSSPVVLASDQTAADPCMFQNKTNLPISQNGTASVQLIALSGATVVYVCSLSLIAAGATTVAITTGTGTACVTGNAAVVGSTTANIANSMSLAANGGLTLGSGQGTVAKGAASSELCMVLGANVFVSGNLTYVQQ